MRNILFASLSILIFLIAACAGDAKMPNEKYENALSPQTENNQADKLRKQIEEIASAAKGIVGVKCTVLETGTTVSFNSQKHFPMQSVYKFPIAMTVLKQIDEGKIKLEQKIRIEKSDFVERGQHSPLRDENPDGAVLTIEELLRLAVSESDGTASDVLLKLGGGFQAV